MGVDNPSVRDYLAEREEELVAKLNFLRKEQEPLENELADVRRARAALGPEPAPLLDVARRLGTGPPGSFEHWTLKQMVVRALQEHFQNGATAQQLLEFFRTAYGRDVQRESLSPQLSRLVDPDKLITRQGRLYFLAAGAREVFGEGVQD